MEIILQQNPTPTHRRCDFDSSTKSFFRKEILVWKGLGGKKGRFSTKTKSSGIQGEGVEPWPQGQKNLNGWQSYRRNYELRITSKKYSNENTHIRFFEVSSFFLHMFLNSDLDRSDH